MKIISNLLGLSTTSRPPSKDAERGAEWIRDPLAHPALEAMSERELADLPFCGELRRNRSAQA